MESGTSRSKWSSFKQRVRKITLFEVLLIEAFAAVIVALLLPPLRGFTAGSPSGECKNHLQQLAHALQNYHETYASFPPAYIADANGKPMHSWRVLILPFIEQRALYEKYRFDEPWDGPNNRKLHSELISVFVCPSSYRRRPVHEQNDFLAWTDYVAVVGPQTAWPGVRPLKLDEITDDREQTILLVEMKNSGIHWMEPRDLNFDEMSFQVNDPAGNAIGSWHDWTTGSLLWKKSTPIVNAGFADGRGRRLPRNITPETLKALLTIHGGEKIDPKELEW